MFFIRSSRSLTSVFSSFRNSTEAVSFRMVSLKTVVDKLEEFAPLSLAESWDNVGLLIEPFTPKDVKTIFLTNDLTEGVLHEAIGKNADLILSYHPPIFASMKRITQSTWKERLVAICLEKRIALYSPHTCWDAVADGVNDWLASSLPVESSTPITKHPELPNVGMGRMLTIKGSLTLREAIEKVKQKTDIKTVQVAIGNQSSLNSEIKTVALCAGSGSTLLRNLNADLCLSGEMPHHEVLDATQRNISVILCNHSNSERGYLKEFQGKLKGFLGGAVDVVVSETDADPLSAF